MSAKDVIAKDVIAKDLTCSFLGMYDMADTAAVSAMNALANAGYVIVPIQPSERMIEAAMLQIATPQAIYSAMLKAADQ